MDNTLNATIRAVIEAVTEFIPVSSTGHLFLFSYFYPFQNLPENSQEFEDLFDIFIQSGAILSVVVLYFRELFRNFHRSILYLKGAKTQENREGFFFWIHIFLSTIPILILGFVLRSFLDSIKTNPYLLYIMSISWILGGFLILIQEKLSNQQSDSEHQVMSIPKALWIGTIQCFALIPGISRSLATILAARMLGFSRKHAAEYSFFLAIPVLVLAGIYKIVKYHSILKGEALWILVYGSIVSFILCLFVIRLFLAYVKRFSYEVFGYYRIALGATILVFLFIN